MHEESRPGAVDLGPILHYRGVIDHALMEAPMAQSKDRRTESKGRSRVRSAVLSLIFPGLGQIVRGRIFAGLLFCLNVALYLVPLVVPLNVGYNVQTPSVLIAFGVWVFSSLDAFLYRSSFLVMALLVSLFCFGSGFLGTVYIFPHLDTL